MSDEPHWRPRVPAAAVLRHDRTRNADVLLLPERVVVLHGSGRAVLDLCDGTRTVDEITGLLSTEDSDSRIRRDVTSFLDRLRTEGCLR
ncbi:pyrroloquinoline quinone biosynthesis peptide chaperone PqqD [Streptomyces sp. NPDC005930]|uniref:pyrroloquinoline quinone biosynthesis peptide chaperone PqqD n=1 Tax=Streptomyces sp. NPDC005930 TaxID=3364736 RepID=UPI0036BEEA63